MTTFHLLQRSVGLAVVALAALPGWSQTVRLDTSAGDIVVELDAEHAPVSTANFLAYVKAGHYDGTIFHRVYVNYIVQGGGFTPELIRKPTLSPIPLESPNGLVNARGTLAMARTMRPNSADAQFFINLDNNTNLDAAGAPDGRGYAVFGKVIQGLDVVDRISAVPTANKGPFQNVPLEPVVIRKATLEK